MRLRFAQTIERLEQADVEVIQWTGPPYSPSLFPVGAAEGLRRALNREALETSTRGVTVCDFAGRLESEVNGNGQTVPRPAVLADGIHPGDAGNALMSRAFQQSLRMRVVLPQGLRAA